MANVKIAVIVGSNRRESINRKFANALIHLGKGKADFHMAEIADMEMFNQDNEATPSPAVTRFKADIEAADGVLIVTPEHNRSMPAALKNAIDWGTRPRGHNNWTGKTVAITGTSQGAISTAIAQQHLRQVIGDLGAVVLGGEVYINFKPDFLDADGHVANEDSRKFLQTFIDRFVELVSRLKD